MKIIRNIISIILAFLIMFAVFLLIGVNLLNSKLLNKQYILSKMEETEFYLQVSREVEEGFEEYIYQSGLPEDTIKDLFTEDMIRTDVNSLIDCLYDGTEIKLSDEKVKNTLDTKIKEYLKSQNKLLNSEGQKNIEKFEELIVKEYRENVNVSTTLYKTGNSALEKVTEISKKIGNWPIIILVILVVLILLINIKDLTTAISYVSAALLSVGILSKLGVNLLFKNIDFDNLKVLAQSLSNLVINICKELLYNLSDNGTIYIVCGITGIIIAAILKSAKDKKVGEK